MYKLVHIEALCPTDGILNCSRSISLNVPTEENLHYSLNVVKIILCFCIEAIKVLTCVKYINSRCVYPIYGFVYWYSTYSYLVMS